MTTEQHNLPELLAERFAGNGGEAPAVITGDRHLTFAELDRRSNQLAAHLTRLGAGPEVVIGVSLPRSPEFVITVLAVLKSGGAFLPLDPGEPAERRRFILDDADVLLTLTKQRLRHDQGAVDACPAEPPVGRPDPAHLAYVIYTSGSTGTPKGVMVQHDSVVNYLVWAESRYGSTTGGAVLHTPLNADLGITSLFVPLLGGQPVHILPGEDAPMDDLPATLARGGLGFVKLTPAHLDVLTDALDPVDTSGAGRVLVGGEALHYSQLAHWRTSSPETVIVNEYGPTEATVACCAHEFPAGAHGDGPVPIGTPIAGATLDVLDEWLQRVPDGAVGELYVGGPPVSRGYLRRPAMTAAAFLPDPRAGNGARIYRTGDFVRRDDAGMLVYLGRADDQIKLRGHRVEMGEIDTVLRSVPGVHAAVAAVRAPGTNRAVLVAFVQPAESSGIAQADVLEALGERLPEHMLPAEVHLLATLPLTTQGKVDRSLLLESTEPESVAGKPAAAPATDLEREVGDIVADLLDVASVDAQTSFFAIGGNSLLAARLVARLMRAYQVDLPVAKWLVRPSVAGFAELIDTYRRHGRDAAMSLGKAPDFHDLVLDDEITSSLQAAR